MNQTPSPAAAPVAPNILGPDYAEPALGKIREAVRGNGLKIDAVRLTKITGEVAIFDAEISLILRTRTMEKIIGGKKNTGEKVEGQAGVRAGIERERLRILGSEETIARIKRQIMERKDMALGTRNEVMKLPFLTKEYVHHQPCRTCGARGQINCQRCMGKGHEICPRCHAQGMEICSQCRGAQLLYNGNTKVPCHKCNGQGRTPCQTCNQLRKIPCSICRTRGTIQCQNCHGMSWQSYITTAEIDVLGTFSFTREQVPDRLAGIIETRARELPALARIDLVKNKPATPGEERELKPDEIIMSYNIRLAYADAEFRLGKAMDMRAFLLGAEAGIADSPPFLETLMKKGMDALHDAAEGRGNVADKIQKAGRYRTLKQAIIASSKYSKGKTAKILAKNNPLGLSSSAIKKIVTDCEDALKNITAKPRRNGAILGAGLAGILYALYLMLPLHASVEQALPNDIARAAADALVAGIGMVITMFVIQISGAQAMKKALGDLLPAGQKNIALSKAGYSGLWAALLCAVIFLAVAELTVQAGLSAPGWYMFLRTPNG